jgi:selenide,water dikinase
MRPAAPVIKDIVLLGGGHSHIAVLKSFGMRPLPGVRLTLISRELETPYSGMLPGLIAGHYTFDQTHIDLRPLARFAGARFFCGSVTGIDVEAGTVELADRPPASFDILSINTGSTPSTHLTPGAADNVVPVKPIGQFLSHWNDLIERVSQRDAPIRIAVVGGGAGGVELSLAVHQAFAQRMPQTPLTLELLTGEDDILTSLPASAARRFRRLFGARGIVIRTKTRVAEVAPGRVVDTSGDELAYDEILWVTQASPPDWLKGAGVELDERGFVLVNDYLQSVSHPNVFAAGDVASMRNHPRPKAGVFAVRQGPPLTRNLRRRASSSPLVRYRPQSRFLTLISTGDRYAVAARGRWSAEGRWAWRWKNWIDTRFMQRFQELPGMEASPSPGPSPLHDESVPRDADDEMRCGGCGAKIPADTLAAALSDVNPVAREDVIVGLHAPDDAAVVAVPENKLTVLSVDGFRPMIDDSYLFGQITANHCLSDIFAMGAEPQTALAIAVMPVWPADKTADELRQMLRGAQVAFTESGTALVGGHTSEGAELSLSFSVTGLIDRERLMTKTSLREGDALILTKALGTGALLAADMRAKAKGRWVDSAIASMLRSNAAAARCLRDHGAAACTDITGFGLLGHLSEMLGESSLGAELALDALPVLDGALVTITEGIVSTLHEKNALFSRHIENDAEARQHAHYPLLFDPQTSGGLLAGIPQNRVETCLAALAARGYDHCSVIGRIIRADDSTHRIRAICST